MPWLLVPTMLLQQQLHLPRLLCKHRISCDLCLPYCTYISHSHVAIKPTQKVLLCKACIVPARSLLCRLAAFSATSKVDPQGKKKHNQMMHGKPFMDFTAARRRLNIVPRFLRLGALVLLLLLRLLLLLELLLLLFLHTCDMETLGAPLLDSSNQGPILAFMPRIPNQ